MYEGGRKGGRARGRKGKREEGAMSVDNSSDERRDIISTSDIER